VQAARILFFLLFLSNAAARLLRFAVSRDGEQKRLAGMHLRILMWHLGLLDEKKAIVKP